MQCQAILRSIYTYCCIFLQQFCNMCVTCERLTKIYYNDNIMFVKAKTWTCPYSAEPTESFWLVEKSGKAVRVPP